MTNQEYFNIIESKITELSSLSSEALTLSQKNYRRKLIKRRFLFLCISE